MQTINLNQNSFRLFPTIYMVQNDTGRELKMILDDVTLAGTETGAVAIKRSDGSYYTIPATLASGENAFTADMTQALTQPSMTECQLKITDENDLVVSSYTFHIKVQPSTDGISEEQLGYSVQEIVNAASAIMNAGLTDDVKQALLQWCSKTVFVDDQGAQYYQDLYDALYPTKTLTSISCVYTQSGTVYDTDSLSSLESDLVVTAHFDDSSTETVTTYTLSGSLTVGTSTITVTYGGFTTTFSVTVTASVSTIKVYNGKGVDGAGTGFEDNANRAVSEMIYVGDWTSFVTQNPSISSYIYAIKNAPNSTTVESASPVLVPSSYIGTTTAQGSYGVFTTTSETLYGAIKTSNKWVSLSPTQNYIRLLFKKDSSGSSPITSLDGTSIYLNGEEYQIIEKPASEFE